MAAFKELKNIAVFNEQLKDLRANAKYSLLNNPEFFSITVFNDFILKIHKTFQQRFLKREDIFSPKSA